MGWNSNHKNPKLKTNEGDSKKAFVSFIIDENGQLSNYEMISGLGEPYDSEAIALIRNIRIDGFLGNAE